MGYIATSNVECACTATEAWEKMRDISVAHHYVPEVDKTVITTDKKEGVGASRKVTGKRGTLDETVTEWKEGKGFTIRLHKGDKPPTPFSDASFTYRIDDIGGKSCKLTTTMIYEMPWGIFGKLLHSLFIGKIVKGSVRDVVLCLKKYYETGEPVTDADLKALRAIPEEKLPLPYGQA
jgi:hypothetical protein